jgi:hypothetical protein
MKHSLLPPDLKEKSGDFYTGPFFAFEVFYTHILSQQTCDDPFKSHPLNSKFFYNVLCHNMNLPFSFSYFWPVPHTSGSPHIEDACLIPW